VLVLLVRQLERILHYPLRHSLALQLLQACWRTDHLSQEHLHQTKWLPVQLLLPVLMQGRAKTHRQMEQLHHHLQQTQHPRNLQTYLYLHFQLRSSLQVMAELAGQR